MSRFLGVGFGHFYKPWFAIRTLLFFVIAGLVFMQLANHAGFYGRKPDAVELRIASPPRWQTCWDVPDGPLAHVAQFAEALLMSFDLLLPLIDLKQSERCEVKDWRAANDLSSPTLPTLPANNMAEAWWSSLLALYAALGLIIIPLFVATVSGLARRE